METVWGKNEINAGILLAKSLFYCQVIMMTMMHGQFCH